MRASACSILAALASVLVPAWADVTIENPRLSLTLADNGMCLSLKDKAANREWDLSLSLIHI